MKKEWHITKKTSKKAWKKRIKGKWMIKRMKYKKRRWTKKENNERELWMRKDKEWKRRKNYNTIRNQLPSAEDHPRREVTKKCEGQI